ncbi:MAG: hypothetical protein OXU75_03210, partial [Deltaproteobacteria bacterium]|nr:hypothetical protein [Deltaproteobacteria bacterium]
GGGSSGPSIPAPSAAGANEFLRVNAAGAAYELADIPKQPLSSFGTVGASGTCAKANSSRDGLTYGSCGSPRVLSNRDPVASGTADPGNRTDVSRSDHVHPGGGGGTPTPLSDQTPQAVAMTGAAGTASQASRGDHVHPEGPIRRELPSPGSGNKGDIPRVNAAGNAYEVVDAVDAVLSGLPALAGQKTKSLVVKEDETGVEWAEVSGGGTDLPEARWVDYVTGIGAPSSDNFERKSEWVFGLTQQQVDSIITGLNQDDILGVAVRGQTRFDDSLSVFWPKGTHDMNAGSSFASVGAFTFFRESSVEKSVSLEIRLTLGPGKLTISSFNSSNQLSGHDLPREIAISGLKVSVGATPTVEIPTPMASAGGRYLRLDAAGAAYEFGRDLDGADEDLSDAVQGLQSVTQDLTVSRTRGTWATSTVTGAGVAVGTTSNAPPTTYAPTQTRPGNGWPVGARVYARIPAGADVTTYRVREVAAFGFVTEYGGAWTHVSAPAGDTAHDYYSVNQGFGGDHQIILEHQATVERTTYHGQIAGWGGDLPAIPSDTATKDYALQTKEDGSGVVWSNEAFSALSVNAQDIGEALERIGHIDMPSDAEASKSALAAGQVWTIGKCTDSGGSRACTAGFADSAHGTQRHLVTHGTGAANATSASFAPVGRLTQHALISGTSYDEFVVIARHVAGNPTRTMIRSCRIPGIQGDWVANAANPVHLIGESGNCSLVAPATGNLTVTWAAPLAGQKIAGDTWRLYGVDWR